MDKKRINDGDEVIVYFSHHEPIRGRLLYTPCATGDIWIIDRESSSKDDDIVNVQNFAYMERA